MYNRVKEYDDDDDDYCESEACYKADFECLLSFDLVKKIRDTCWREMQTHRGLLLRSSPAFTGITFVTTVTVPLTIIFHVILKALLLALQVQLHVDGSKR